MAYNKLSAAEAERLVLLMEECAEVQHIVCKILRHGYESRNPLSIEGLSNRNLLMEEIGHVQLAAQLMIMAGDIDAEQVDLSCDAKRISAQKYMHHQDSSLFNDPRGRE